MLHGTTTSVRAAPEALDAVFYLSGIGKGRERRPPTKVGEQKRPRLRRDLKEAGAA